MDFRRAETMQIKSEAITNLASVAQSQTYIEAIEFDGENTLTFTTNEALDSPELHIPYVGTLQLAGQFEEVTPSNYTFKIDHTPQTQMLELAHIKALFRLKTLSGSFINLAGD